jgi:hypothetical protein
MNAVTLTKAYANLSEKLGNENAENITAFITETVKEDVYNVKEDLNNSIKNFATKDELKKEIAEAKAELIKWMFIFWVGQLAATFGLLYFFIKK